MSSPSESAPFPYITDVEFPSRYTSNQAPPVLSYVAAVFVEESVPVATGRDTKNETAP